MRINIIVRQLFRVFVDLGNIHVKIYNIHVFHQNNI